jgi:hypothetical protein
MKSLLPLLAGIRRNTGLPHRIVIDEAHYFLHDPNVDDLLDLTLGAYTLITYRLMDLDLSLRNAIECIVVKRTTAPRELQTLTEMLQTRNCCPAVMADLASLRLDEAVLLPGMRETGGECLKFKLFPRLTSHVRHKAKYLDVQLLAEQGFWFTDVDGRLAGPARTFKEFLALLEQVPGAAIAAHAQRGDFSRWVGDVFHDHALASEIRKVEQRFRLGHIHDLTESTARLIQERYEFSPGRVSEPEITFSSRERDSQNFRAARIGGR